MTQSWNGTKRVIKPMEIPKIKTKKLEHCWTTGLLIGSSQQRTIQKKKLSML